MISYYTQTSHTLVSKRHARPPLVFLVSYLQFGYHHCIFSENTTPKHLVQWGNIFFLVPDKSKCCKIHCFDSNIETSVCINKHKQSKELLVCFCSSTKNRMALCVSILIINCLEYCRKLQYFFFYILPKIHQKSETATTFVKDQLLLMQFQHNYITYKQEVQKQNACQCDGYWTDDILGLLGSSTISGIDPVVGKITKLNWIFMRTTHVFYINFTKHVLGQTL